MPLLNLEDYERLGEHLNAIEGNLAEFAARHNYTVYPRLHGGRYPNRRITQEGTVMRSIHISMDDAPNGERFNRFFPKIPYSICGLAWIDDFQKLERWHGPRIVLQKIPFSSLAQTLVIQLPYFHAYLADLSEEYIRACAVMSKLSTPPSA